MIKKASSTNTKTLKTTKPVANLERERLTSLINSMADGVVATDKNLKVIVYNGAALNILDLNTLSEGADLTPILKLKDKDDKHVTITHLVEKSNTATVSRDHRITYKDGSDINLYISVAPVHLGYGKNSDQGFVVVLRDITHEKSLEEERDEFISVVSHELRTPIAIAEGNLSNAQLIASNSSHAPEIDGSLQQAYDQVTFLSSMINDLSMLSRADRGKLALETENINVHDLLKDLEHAYVPQAKEKGLTFHIEISPSLELLRSSKLYVREILQNFITNAIKYTIEGSVTVSAKDYNDGVRFSVRDTGIGIGKADQEKVFNKFFRSEDYRTRKHNGTGLGLYVTAKLAHILHAHITLSSEIHKGSTFEILIPNSKT